MLLVRRLGYANWSDFVHARTVDLLSDDLVHKLDTDDTAVLLWQKELVSQKLLIHGVLVRHVCVDGVSEAHLTSLK